MDPGFNAPVGVAIAAIPQPEPPVPPAPQLPVTGSPAQTVLTIAVSLIGLGAALLLISRRRAWSGRATK